MKVVVKYDLKREMLENQLSRRMIIELEFVAS